MLSKYMQETGMSTYGGNEWPGCVPCVHRREKSPGEIEPQFCLD